MLITPGVLAYLVDRREQKKFNDFCKEQEKRNKEDLFI